MGCKESIPMIPHDSCSHLYLGFVGSFASLFTSATASHSASGML